MCLVAFALNQHPDYPLILIANRDEFFERPTKALHQWQDHPAIFGGRDLEAHGTWLAINQSGRWAALTNFRDPSQTPGKTSRGDLVVQCLTSSLSLNDWFEQLQQKSTDYSGFNLVAGDFKIPQCIYYSNQDSNIRTLDPGFHAISNGKYQDQWPKMQHLRSMLKSHLINNDLQHESLFNSLASQHQPPENQLPDTGIPKHMENRLATPFITPFQINGKTYGTRSCAILMIDEQQHVTFFERSIGKQGKKTDDILLNWPVKAED